MIIIRKKAELPADAKKIRLTKGLTAFVSAEDYERVNAVYWRAVKSAGKYYARARRVVRGKTITIRMHRFILDAPAYMRVHHIDHNTLNNTRENLQLLTERDFRLLDGWHYFEH